MKHSNDKVIVTVYLYNKNKLFLSNKLKKLYYTLFPTLKETIYNLKSKLIVGNNDAKLGKKKNNNANGFAAKPTERADISKNYLNNLLIRIKKNNLAQKKALLFLHDKAKKAANVKKRKNTNKSSNKAGIDFFSIEKKNKAKLAEQNKTPLNIANSKVKSITLNSLKLIKKVRKYKNFIIKLLK